MPWRVILRLVLLALVLASPVHAEEAEEEAPGSWQPPSKSQLVSSCHRQCIQDGYYDHICNGICDAGDSVNPEKFTRNSYECYKSCTSRPEWGALWCSGRCLAWARTLEMQETDLPPERGVQ